MRVKFRSSKQAMPDHEHGMRIQYGVAKKTLPKLRWYLILLVAASPIILFFGNIIYSFVVVDAPGVIRLPTNIIRSTVSGTVSQIYVKDRDHVVEDQILMTLQNPDLEAKINRIEGDIIDLESIKPIVNKQQKNKVVRHLNEQLKSARKLLSFRKERLDSIQYLFDQGAATLAELSTASSRYDQASISYNNIKRDIAKEQEISSQDIQLQTNTQQNEILRNKLKRELTLLKEQRMRQSIRANTDGKITELPVTQGEFIASGTHLLSISTQDKASITAFLDPKDARFANVGQTAVVKLPNGIRFPAVVDSVPKLTSQIPSNTVGPLGARPRGIVVELLPKINFKDDFRVQGLPVTVKFNMNVWE